LAYQSIAFGVSQTWKSGRSSAMNIERFRTFQASHRFSTIASGFIHVLMMGCLAISYVQAAQRFFPDWATGHVIVMAMVVSVEAMLAYFTQREKTIKERIAFHLAEWLVIMLLTQFVIYARRGFAGLARDVALLEESLMHFFHPEFMLTISPLFFIWLLSIIMAADLSQLEVDESELQLENPEVLEKDRRQIRRGMSERVFVVGFLLILMAFIARLELVQIFGEIPATRAPVFNVVAYYVLALVMISQVQLSALRGHWLWSKAPIRSGLAGNWLKYSLLFFAIIALITIFLPTQYTMGFLDTIGGLIYYIGQAVLFLVFIVLWPIAQLINFLFSLFQTNGDQEPLNIQPPEMLGGEGGTAAGWWDLLKSILFWALMIGITGYFILYYVRQNQVLWDRLRGIPLLQWLRRRFNRFWLWLRGINHKLAAVIAAGRQILFPSVRIPAESRRSRTFNMRRASARQKVIFFYLRLVERGKQEGVERRPAQTPIQYRETLEQTLPEVEGEIDGMTASFMEARYTRHVIPEEQAGVVQNFWKRILQALRGKKNREQ
jgi:hypothetical protein